jgi:hypothetical protein
MISLFRLSPLAITLALLTLFTLGAKVQAQTHRVRFPTNFDQMVMYGDYRRGTGGELAYALRKTLDIAKAAQPLPPGTRLVLEIYDNGALTGYFAMERGVDGSLGFAAEQCTGEWHIQQFDTSKLGVSLGEAF